jgi:hypothetical protein
VCSCDHDFQLKCTIRQSACVRRALFINCGVLGSDVSMFPNADRYIHRTEQHSHTIFRTVILVGYVRFYAITIKLMLCVREASCFSPQLKTHYPNSDFFPTIISHSKPNSEGLVLS